MNPRASWVVASFVMAAVAGTAAPPEPEQVLLELEGAVREAPDDLLVGNAYRRAAVRAERSERAVQFLTDLLQQHRDSSAFRITLALAYVDRLSDPGVSPMTRGVLSGRSIDHLNAALELEPDNWVALFSRGMNHLYWPRRAHADRAIRDFESCLELQENGDLPRGRHFVLAYLGLGDAHAKGGDVASARRAWQRGLDRFPGDESLIERLAIDTQAVAEYLERKREGAGRIATDLSYLSPP